MGIALFHGDFAWLLAGVIAFIGVVVFLAKLLFSKLGSLLATVVVWIFVYTLHGGTATGVMTATVAALLFDVLGIPLLKLLGFFKRRRYAK